MSESKAELRGGPSDDLPVELDDEGATTVDGGGGEGLGHSEGGEEVGEVSDGEGLGDDLAGVGEMVEESTGSSVGGVDGAEESCSSSKKE